MVTAVTTFVCPAITGAATSPLHQLPGLELALRTGDPESALEQLRPLRAPCLSALGARPTRFRSERPRANRGTQVSDKRRIKTLLCRWATLW
jgi:hypothetical protein